MIRFMADADLNDAIVGGCRRREPAIDFLSVNDDNLEGVPDPGVLALVAAEDRILVSHDFQTMPRHVGDLLQARGSSPGLILVPQHMPIGEVIEELLLIWGASEAEEWRDRWRRLDPTGRLPRWVLETEKGAVRYLANDLPGWIESALDLF